MVSSTALNNKPNLLTGHTAVYLLAQFHLASHCFKPCEGAERLVAV